MNKYESIIILKPSIDEKMKKEKIKEYKKFLKELTNTKVEVEDLGKRKLAYEVKGNTEGVYAIFKFGGNPNHISDLEKKYRTDEDIIKFVSIKQDELYEEDEDSEEDEQEM
mgnify:CR=1 FL=1